MGLRSVTKLWAHTHLQDPRADQHSKRTLTVFPFPHFLHSPFSTLLMVPQGGRESLLFIHLFLREKNGGSASGRQTEVEGDAEHRR